MARTKKAQDQSSKTLEQILWATADQLRGNLDASQYKSVVLGIVFLKYVNDCFDKKHKELVDEGLGMEEDSDEYLANNIFYVPTNARWAEIAASALLPEIGEKLDEAMDALGKENSQLAGVLPRNYASPELDKRRLGNVVDIFNNIDFNAEGDARDVLGRVYEYFLGEFAREEGKKGGEFYTPACVVRTIVEVIKPFRGKIYDPACGSGGMFVQSEKFVERHSGNINDISVYGQELNSNTWRLAQMNVAIHGIEANFGRTYADTFFNDQHPYLKADFVMANPPFNISEWGADKLSDDPRWQYGTPPNGNANFAWMQHMIYHLADDGRIGLVLANGSLSSTSGGEGDIRKNIIEADLVEGIVAMPNQLFYNVQIPCCLWFLTKRKQQPHKTLFIDARNLGFMRDRTHRELSSDEGGDIARIATAFDLFREGKLEAEAGFSAVASIEEIAQQDYVLTPGRYVGVAAAPEDAEPFADKVARLTADLGQLFAKSASQEKEIRKQLASIGITIPFDYSANAPQEQELGMAAEKSLEE